MRRRQALKVLGGVSLALMSALPGAAQPAQRVVRIGVLAAYDLPPLDGLRDGLRERGYVEGENLRFEYRWGEGQAERYPLLAADLVSLGVDAIVTWGTPPAWAAKAATSTIPIIMGSSGDPVAAGLVPNLARPGANLTGFTSQSGDLEAKRLQYLKELLPGLTRLGVLWNRTNPVNAPVLGRVREAAAALAVTVDEAGAAAETELANALAALAATRPDAVLVLADMFLLGQKQLIVAFGAEKRIPGAYSYPEFVRAGGLLSYSPDYREQFRRAADYVDRILNGTPPGVLPVQQPTKFELAINLRTAKQLGLVVPASLLARADEVIE